MGSVKSFLVEKFWLPITDESVYYNPFNTAAYSAIFALAAAYVGKPLMKKLDLKPDREFFTGIAPFVFLGGALRSLKDVDLINTVLLETPFIYLVMFIFTSISIIASKQVSRRYEIEYWKPLSSIGGTTLVLVLSAYSFPNIMPFLNVMALFLPASFLTYVAGNYFDLDPWFTVPVSAHWFDAATSFVAITGGANEKHVLAQLFVNTVGPEGMFVMKALIIIPAVYYIGENVEGFDRGYYLFLVALLGFALGTRNLVSTLAA